MKKVLTVAFSSLLIVASPVFAKMAYAERVASSAGSIAGCMTENAQVSINFNGVEADANVVKSKFDAKMAEIEKLLKEAALEKYEMQSMNYNISPQSYGSSASLFNYNGSFSYTIAPSGKATTLMADLTKKGYQASVNVSAYRNGGVPCPSK